MEPLNFEPFGERLAQDNGLRQDDRASRWLMRIGSLVFWSLVVTIVAARALYFDPAVFAGFERLAGLTHHIF
jgi:hypothetical protein